MPAICQRCARPLHVREWELQSCPGCGAPLFEMPPFENPPVENGAPLPDPRASMPVSKLAIVSFCCGLMSVPVAISIASDPISILAPAYLPLFGTGVLAGIASRLIIMRGRRRGEKWANRGIWIALGWFVLMWLTIPLGVHNKNFIYARVHDSCKELVKAMLRYADEHEERLPPSAIIDKRGTRLLSWRVLLLPYLDHDQLYQQFKLDEAWDGPNNRKLLNAMPDVYKGGLFGLETGTTQFQVFVGPGTAFEKRPGGAGWRSPEDFRNGRFRTMLIALGSEPVPWTKPADMNFDPRSPLPAIGAMFYRRIRSNPFPFQNQFVNFVALADGSVRDLPSTINDATLRAAIIRNGGDALAPDW